MKPVTDLLYRTVSCRTSRISAAVRPQRLLMLLILLGVACGTAFGAALPDAVRGCLMQGLALSDGLRTLWDVYRDAVCPVLIMLAAMLFAGTSAIGQPVTLGALLIRGAGLGLAASDCFLREPLQTAVCAAALLLLPYGFATALILTHGAEESLKLSRCMAGYLFRGKADTEPAERRRSLLLQMLLLLLLTLTAGGLHTLLLWRFNDLLLG